MTTALRIISIIAAIALLLALAPWPYGYYQLLRVIVFAAGAYGAFTLWEHQRGPAIMLVICATIFNPFLPVHLNREIWSVLNLAGAALFAMVAYKARPANHTGTQ